MGMHEKENGMNRTKTRITLHAVPMVIAIIMGTTLGTRADRLWNNSSFDGNWTNAANWGGDGLGNTIISPGNLAAGAGTVVTVDSGSTVSVDGDFLGPEWGMTLNVDGGSLTHAGFAFAPVGDALTPSVINVSNSGYLEVGELLLGDNWWFSTAPGVDLNITGDSTVKARGWTWIGGHVSLQSGTLDIGGNVNMNAGGQNNAQVDITGGTWIVRGADISANVASWIGSGELTAYGGAGTINVDTTSVPGGTVITGVIPEPATIGLIGFAGAGLLYVRRRIMI